MKKLAVALLLAAGAALAQAPMTHAKTQPALSPDGATIAFASGGAIWTVAAQGGAAHLLIADPATNAHPMYSPDGKWLAFESQRTGNGDIYLFDLASAQLRRLTWDDGTDALDGFSPDSQWVYFSSTSHNIGGMNDVYRVRIGGGTPLPVTSERYVNEFFAAPAADGSLAFDARGLASAQWWRNGHAHIDETEIWRVTPAAGRGGQNQYTRLLASGGAKNLWPMWGSDGKTLYFMSDRSGSENLWELAPGAAAPRALTHFTSGRVLWPTIGARGKAVVFERGFAVWKTEVGSGKSAEVAITLEGAPGAPSVTHETVTNVTEMAVARDGKKVAFVAHGEVFAAGTERGGEAIPVTHTGRLQFDLQWSPDNHHLAYVSDRDGHNHIYQYDFDTNQETALTRGASDENHLAYSPDGKKLVFQRGETQAVILDLGSGQESVAAQGYFGSLPPLGGRRPFAWSADSKYLAYLDAADGWFPNAYIVLASGGKPQQASFLANENSSDPQWSPNGKFLLLQTSQRTEATRIARIDLQPRLPVFREDVFQKLFENEPAGGGRRGGRGGAGAAAEPAATPTPDPVYTGISQRMSLLPMLDAREPVISPDGKWLAYVSSEGGSGGNIYIESLDEEAAAGGGGGRGGRGGADTQGPRQLTSTTSGKRSLQFTADSKEIYYLDGSRISLIAVAGGPARAVNVSAQLDVDFSQEKNEIFAEAWRYLRDNYMNAAMNGTDWDAVEARYAPAVAGARGPDDLRWVLSEMIGDLNSSHSGINAPAGGRRSSTGHLGLMFDRIEFEDAGKLCATEVVPLSPAALAGVRVGDCLDTVDGTAIGPQTNLDQVLEDTIGRKLNVKLSGTGGERTVAIQPVAAAAGKNLIYGAWVEHNREQVDKLSGGALGYIHMIDMSQAALDKLYVDLDSTDFAKKGVVVDVRNNNGGFVNAYALDVLTRHPYLTMIPRGFPQGPARVALGQRALEKPTVLITNQNSLSDSEDFTEGYEAMHLGKVVGVPTAGWIIFTSNVNLIDGSSLRLPSTRILDHNGKDMELHPRPVDVEVQNPIGSWQAGEDAQLAAAVKTLLAQLGPRAGAVAEKRP